VNRRHMVRSGITLVIGLGGFFWGLVVGCSGVLAPPEPNAIPETTNYNAGRKVLSIRWRLQLFEPEENRDLLNQPQKDSSTTYSKTTARINTCAAIDAIQYGSPSASPDGKNVIIGGVDGSFYCLNSSDGTVIWRHFLPGPIDGEPLITDEVVYVGAGDGTVYAFSLSDGAQIWSHRANGSLDGKPVLTNDRLLVMSDTNTLICLEAKTGKLLWSYHRDIPAGRFQVKGVATPLVVGSNVIAGFSDGTVAVLSNNDGSLQLSKDLSQKGDRFTDIDTNPTVARNLLLLGSNSQGLFALDPTDLGVRWKVPMEGPSSYAIDEKQNMLWLSTSQSKVLAIRLNDGKILWSFDTRKGNLSRPVLSGKYLLVSSSEHSLLVLDSTTGQLEQTINPGKGSNAPPVVSGKRVFWVSNGQIIYGMDIID
jgi:outer membrane protein assembly factor BamB